MNSVQCEATPQKPSREFSVAEGVFAWLSLLAGYFFCRIFPVIAHPLGGLLFVISIFGVTAVILKLRGAHFGIFSLIAALSALAAASSLFFSSNSFTHFFSYVYAGLAYGMFVYGSTGNLLEGKLSSLLPADFFRALFIAPFWSFIGVFSAIFSGKKKSGIKVLLYVLLGLVLTLIPTFAVGALLSYDSGFSNIIGSIFKLNLETVITNIFSVAMGVPVGMYIFGLYLSSVDKKCDSVINADSCRKAADSIRIMPAPTALAAVVPMLFVYAVFFVSQWKYYVSGFIGVLPDKTSYAQYAREGFFQLCIVSVINLIILSAICVFMRKKEGARDVLLRVLSLVLSVFTLGLISTAAAKMVLYIKRYGLTPLRVYASWMIAVLAVIFLLICVKQFARRIKLIPVSVCVCVVMYLALSLSGVDSFIAKYNTDRYINGSLAEIDVEALSELGDAAVPQLIRVGHELDRKNGTSLADSVNREYDYDEEFFENYDSENTYECIVGSLRETARNRSDSVFSFTLPRARANAALKAAGIKIITQ